ncbi:hypothetical protein E4L96_19740 [Massilia arenosa]|uniref:Uncharacterized protein n=1 Tax=Zemynaea arenosa TaxID=2561931 RepID=A0A4Y9RZY0_9BURK|nr:hypothetical protein [Massilia arenosa]TFW13336.1 hypothetical protein E4L96_19740 [Massilia arenosa]
MRTLMVCLAVAILGCLSVALGSIWESQVHPMKATVGFVGASYSGHLSRSWQGDMVLWQDDGTALHFADGAAEFVRYDRQSEQVSMVRAWRSWVPLVLYGIVAGAVLCRKERGKGRKRKQELSGGTRRSPTDT